MLLAIDVGNTNTVAGIFKEDRLCEQWRITTSATRTADEYLLLLRQLLELCDRPPQLSAAIFSSVVPAAEQPLSSALGRGLGLDPMRVGPGMRSGMPILTENPKEVGADRIVNAVAAYARVGAGVIVVDFGTATTFDCISKRGEYLGGAICPGLAISADALHHHAAKLPRVELARPQVVLGKNTVQSMQAGLYFGYVSMVDGLVKRLRGSLDYEAYVLATGGLAAAIAESTETIDAVDELLTLTGLRLLYERNV